MNQPHLVRNTTEITNEIYLPEHHGLSKPIVTDLVFKDDEKPALTDVQYEALDAGVGQGESLLVVSPTSTGKLKEKRKLHYGQ